MNPGPFRRRARHSGLVIHSAPEEVLGTLSACSGIQWDVAQCAADVVPALERSSPEIVFSIKHTGFQGAGHRPALVAPSVRWFHVGGSGTDHLVGLDAEGVRLTTSAGVLAPFLAERAAAALLYFTTGMDGFAASQRAHRWTPTRFRPLSERTVLVVGAGASGSLFAERVRAFGAPTIGVRRRPRSSPAFDAVHPPEALMELLPEADVLALHVPLSDETRGLLGEAELELLPQGAIVLNSARGAVLDRHGLERALGRNVHAAWLDVFDEEPLPAEDPLWDHPRVLLTPHCADQVHDFPGRFAEHFRALWDATAFE